MTQWRSRLLLTALLATTPELAADASAAQSAESAAGGPARTTEHRIGGRTPEQWREWFKAIDLSGPETAAAVPELIAVVEAESLPATLRMQAAHTLGRLGERGAAAVPVLTALLKQSEGDDDAGPPRQWGLKALALMGPPAREAVPDVLAVLNNPAPSHVDRLLSLEALGRIGPAHPDTLGGIVAVLRRTVAREGMLPPEDLELAVAAVDVLSLFRGSAAPAIPTLLELTRHAHEPLRRSTVTTLGKTLNPLVMDALVDALLFDESPAVQDAAAVALADVGAAAAPVLQRLLADDDAEIRARAADALRRIGRPAAAAAPALTARLADDSPLVRLEAAEALWGINRETGASLPVLLSLLGAPERELRMRSHRLLVEIGRQTQSPELLQRLQELAGSRDPQVRQAAYLALREITQPAGK